MKIGLGIALSLALATPALAAPADGFAAFWPAFAAAAAKDDVAALRSMVALGPGLGDAGGSFAKFHATNLGPARRRCLARAKPKSDVDPQGTLTYAAFCGEMIYVFSRAGGAWKLTDLAAND